MSNAQITNVLVSLTNWQFSTELLTRATILGTSWNQMFVLAVTLVVMKIKSHSDTEGQKPAIISQLKKVLFSFSEVEFVFLIFCSMCLSSSVSHSHLLYSHFLLFLLLHFSLLLSLSISCFCCIGPHPASSAFSSFVIFFFLFRLHIFPPPFLSSTLSLEALLFMKACSWEPLRVNC